MEDFTKFICRFRSEKGQGYTHTSIGNPRISLNIKDDQLPAFFTAYKRAMVGSLPLHLTEKPTNPSAMRADLDFRFVLPADPIDRKRVYETEHVFRIAKAYFQILHEYLDAPPEYFVAYVLEKSKPTEYRGKMKDGIHIVWPHLVTSPQFQHWVRKKVLDNAKKIFSGLPLVNMYDDVVDVAIIDRNAWQMYGSTKPDCEPYRVTRVLKFEQDDVAEVAEVDTLENVPIDDGVGGAGGPGRCTSPIEPDIEDAPGTVIDITPQFAAEDELNFVELFSMRNKSTLTPLLEHKKKEIEEYIRCVLPTMDDRRKTKLHQQIFGKSINHTKNYTSDDELHLARQLVVECLSAHRAESYEDWVKLGWTLRNIDYRLIDAWVEFSKVSSKYISGQCEKLWDTMRIDTLGMGTLRWWARLDHEQRYNDILESNVISLIDKCTNDQAHYDVARVVYSLFKDEYRFTSNDTWYVFMKQKHRWVRSREGLKMRMELSNRVCCEYMKRANHWSAQANVANGDQAKDLCMKRHQQLMAIAWALKKSGYKDSVMKECKCLFADEHFEQILDSHVHLLGFENGVYDLRMHEFRGGSPDDYISFSTGRYYHAHDPESIEAKEIDTYFKQVFTNPNVCKYFKDLLILLIDGGIRQEKFYVFTGNGCHAAGTQVLMYDGKMKNVEDVAVGEKLMGDDNTSRTVQELFRGQDEMYKITPVKGEPFKVNKEHVLSLKFTNLFTVVKRDDGYYKNDARWRAIWYERNGTNSPKSRSKTFKAKEDAVAFSQSMQDEKLNPLAIYPGDVIDIKVNDLLTWNTWWTTKGNTCLFKHSGVEFPSSSVQLAIDPWMLGHWLGDGTSAYTQFTTADQEVVDYYTAHLPQEHALVEHDQKGKAKTYGIKFTGKRVGRYTCQNEITNGLRMYGLVKNKHIPHAYKTASRTARLALLAGILDADGCYQRNFKQYTLTQKNETLIDDIIYLVRSLGFACYKKQIQCECCNNGKVGTYYTINICGKGLEEIPCIIPHKVAEVRVKKKDVLLNSFKMEPIGVDDFYGFELDGNRRYTMGDFTITHNSNSKSKILELVQKAVGEYYCILPIALLTQKRAASNSAQSELERTKGRRVAVMQEPGESEKLNIGLMKELSGGDIIQCRGLFKEPVEFRPQFKMIMTCNELPEVPGDDGGTWRRIRVIEFKSKFCENPDPRKNNEFPIDPELADKFERWSDAFISMLIDHHKKTNPALIKEPMEVRIATESYKKNNDAIGQFVEERIEVVDDAHERVQLNVLYTEFKTWAASNVAKGKRIPEKSQIKAYFEKQYGAYPQDKGWRRMRFRRNEEDADSDAEADA